MEIEQYFKILELNPNASPNEVRQAYRDLVQIWHPDRFQKNPRLREKAVEKVKELNRAYKQIATYIESVNRLRDTKPGGPAASGGNAAPRAGPVFHPPALSQKRIMTVVSGKGGVGKSNFSLNMAVALSQINKRVMILDADLGMANVDVLCGLTPKFNLGHVINRVKRFEDVVVEVYDGVKVVPGVSGVSQLTELSMEQQTRFFQELAAYDKLDNSEFVLVDIGAGMGRGIISLSLAGHECVVVMTPEPTSLMGAYALIKTLHKNNPEIVLRVLLNMAKNEREALLAYTTLNRINQNFLKANMDFLGYIPHDLSVRKAVKTQRPYLLAYPNCPASRHMRTVARKLAQIEQQGPSDGFFGFFKRLSSVFGNK